MTTPYDWRARLARAYAAALLALPDVEPDDHALGQALDALAGQPLSSDQRARLLAAERARGGLRGEALALPWPAAGAGESAAPTDGLGMADLAALPEALWLACVAWLLGAEGYTLERETGTAVGESPDGPHVAPLWRGRQGEAEVVVGAVRLPAGWVLPEREVRYLAARAAGQSAITCVLVSTAPATVGATVAARQLGVRLLAGEALAALLARVAHAAGEARAAAHDEAAARAAAASQTYAALLAALDSLSGALPQGSLGIVTGRRAVRTAATQLRGAAAQLARALLAWETLAADWHAAFAERPARDNSLEFARDAAGFDELAARGEHLRNVTSGALARLAEAPAAGELSYSAWRRDLLDEIGQRLRALRWRIAMVDPARWRDAAEARDAEAQQRAIQATNAADHAAARALKGAATLRQRAGLPE